MSDRWYREPFELPPYVDGFGQAWAFTEEQVGGPVWEEPQWLEGWPEDLHWTLFKIEVGFSFWESYWARLVEGDNSARPKGLLGL